MMRKITKKKIVDKVKAANVISIKDYINDPYFVKKREIAAVFLKKAGLPKLFKQSQAN